MKTNSILFPTPVLNTRRKFGAAPLYYPAVVRRGGAWVPALFTADQIGEAIARAKAQPEDAPKPGWLARLGMLFARPM